ncbi:uridine kinase [Demequina sp. NBRC 110056]|uniref:uridine kinase family protein n=1 Tax=Demequina sp. NBRC 110056 TaxID=1570345 RepID=UPI000A028198|nr:hypothetical protein [Demequina sp. NBRC 110056]
MSNVTGPGVPGAQPTVSEIVARARATAPRLGATRLILVDGPAGSGKTTLAGRITVALGGEPSAGAGTYDPSRAPAPDAPAQLLHADDMYEGWDGLEQLDEVLVTQVLEPLAAGQEAGFAMWDWQRGERTDRIAVPVRPFLVIEGVGVARREARAFSVCTVWVEAPEEVRLARGIARDGEGMRAEWLRWQPREMTHFTLDGTREAADMIVDGTSPIRD